MTRVILGSAVLLACSGLAASESVALAIMGYVLLTLCVLDLAYHAWARRRRSAR